LRGHTIRATCSSRQAEARRVRRPRAFSSAAIPRSVQRPARKSRTPTTKKSDVLFRSDSINYFTNILARFEEGNFLRWHFDSGAGYRIASDASSSLARAKASESADFNLVAGLQSTGNTIKYDANDDVGFLPGHLNSLANLFSQIGPGHVAHARFITKESITVLLGAPNVGPWPRSLARELATPHNPRYILQPPSRSPARAQTASVQFRCYPT
jgi:hypothetical protein